MADRGNLVGHIEIKAGGEPAALRDPRMLNPRPLPQGYFPIHP